MNKIALATVTCFFLMCSLLISPAAAQLDDVSKKATQLEADLNKLLDTSPKAGQVMAELVKLYHDNGRAFGLIRTGQKFMASQPAHRQHREIMLKLLDGLVVMSRNKDIVATSRQFLGRYGKDKSAIDVGLTLARTLRIMNQNKEAAAAYEDTWQRDPKGHRDAGIQAVKIYGELNNTQGFKDAARLSHAMFDKLPNDAFAAETAWQAFHFYRRFGDAINSNVVGNKILSRKLPLDIQRKASLHETMAENYWNNSQRANAIAAVAKARKVADNAVRHRRHARMMSDAQSKSAELAPVADAYFKKYSDLDDRWQVLTELAYALQRDQRADQALQLLAKVLPHDASTHDAAFRVAEWVKQDEAGFKQAEKMLLDALGKNKDQKQQAKIRYALTFYVYRDRMKNVAKARQTAFDLITKSPDSSGYTTGAMSWLFGSAPDEPTFQREFKDVLKAGITYPNLTNLNSYIPSWIKSARRSKQLRGRSDWAKAEHQKFYSHPAAAAFAKAFNPSRKKDTVDAREQLIKPNNLKKLSDYQARALLSAQAYWYRHYSSSKQRAESVRLYRLFVERDPNNLDALDRYLDAASHYASQEEAGEAVKLALKRQPVRHGSIWYRIMATANRSKDKAVIKSAFAWVNKAQAAGAFNPYQAYDVAQWAFDAGLKEEAKAYWKKGIEADPYTQYGYHCADRLVKKLEGDAKLKTIASLIKLRNDYHGAYASWLANEHFNSGDMAKFESVLRTAIAQQAERPFRSWGMGEYPAYEWISKSRATTSKLSDDDKRKVFAIVRDLRVGRTSASATLALLELDGAANPDQQVPTFKRLIDYQRATTMAGRGQYDWDIVKPYAQSALSRKDYFAAATLLTGMLNNMTQVDKTRQKDARGLVGQCYSRMGVVGMAIDENSPYAPLLQAALYLRIGDEKLAFDTYSANQALFDTHRDVLPVDLVLFVAESHMVAGGDDNHNRAEDILRGWLVKHGDSKNIEDATKASVQLLIAKNYFGAKRYEVARSEFQSIMNRYPKTNEALEAEFGVGETFMAQKIFDQAEQIFEKLSNSREREVVIRAEFLRGVLAHRRGDRDEARDIFKSVLERVPDISLANLTLFNLSEVYGQEQRYIEQLELLNTVGRLGRASKRWHTPGATLSIVVQDSDLGISRGHTKIPVIVTTLPGGDQELIYLHSGGAGKGLFRGDLDTILGDVEKGDKILQLTGKDVVRCDYPDAFKAEFKNIPLADAEIRIAADAKFDVASSKIVDEEKETFSQQLAKEEKGLEAEDERQSQKRPQNQIKPGNLLYMRVQDADRDLSDKADEITIKVVASSGDQVQVQLIETGPHTGMFEATAKTGELPAGALASDNSIDRNPLMAIDRDPETYWQSEPDGATPKWLSVDMKDLKEVSRVNIWTPDPVKGAPVRGVLQGSHDGRFWFRMAAHPAAPVADSFAPLPDDKKDLPMSQRVYRVRSLSGVPTWDGVARLTKTTSPESVEPAEQLTYDRPKDDTRSSFFVVWQGRFVQARAGAVRFNLTGSYTAAAVDGVVELAMAKGSQAVDVWLDRGVHDVRFVSVSATSNAKLAVTRARENINAERVTLAPFHKNDYDVNQPEIQAAIQAGKAPIAKPVTVTSVEAKVTKVTKTFGPFSSIEGKPLANWTNEGDIATWQVKVDSPGAYKLWMNWSHAGVGSEAVVTLGDQTVETAVTDTGDWKRFVDTNVGTFHVDKPGTYTLTVKPKKIANGGLMDLKSISLRPTASSAVVTAEGTWQFQFKPHEIRYVRFVVNEYTGEAVAINHVEVKGESGEKPYIPTEADVLALASNDELEIAAGDTVVASYTDEFTFSAVSATGEAGRNRVLKRELQATYYNGKVMPVAYEFVRGSGGVGTIRKELMRVDPGDRIIIEVTDYDLDQTNERDTIDVLVSLNDGDPIKLTATETGEYTGVFTKEIDTADANAKPAAAAGSPAAKKEGGAEGSPESPVLKIKPGDRIYIRYVDRQNTFPGHSVKREAVVYANVPTEGLVRVIETRFIRPPADAKNQRPQTVFLDPQDGKDVASVAFEVPITVEVIDPDRAKDSLSSVLVELTTTDGAKVKVNCVISKSFSSGALAAAYPESRNWALEEGRFVGQVIMQLGSKDSPSLIPLTDGMPSGLVGRPVLVEKMEDSDEEPEEPTGVTRVLNLTGKDRVTALYRDELRPDKQPEDLTSLARLISNGQLAITDRDYSKPIEQLHVGEKLFLVVTDADLDISDARDKVSVTIKTDRGETETFEIEETLSHSGVFTGSIPLKASDKPTAGNSLAASPEVEAFFGDTLTVTYLDKAASTESGELELNVGLPIVIGTNGLVKAFSKVFGDEKLAVETRFTIAESYFELFKSHKRLERDEQMTSDLESGKRVLREVMEDYPDPKYVPRIQYLLGQFAQELQSWDEAINAYSLIVRNHPDHALAPDAQYKLGQVYEESGDFDEAVEAYVTLAATYPNSPLISSVMIRISDYFFKNEQFIIAANVGEKFVEKFDSHQHASKMAFRIGQCYYKAEQFDKSAVAFDKFVKIFPEDELTSLALFWSGEAYRQRRNVPLAFRRYNRCRWDFPESDAAKYARGRLALPEMLQQFEREANLDDN